MKTCRVCGVEKPDILFRPQPNPKTLRKECRKCEALANRKRWGKKIDADPELRQRYLAQQAEYRKRDLERVRAYQKEYHRVRRNAIRTWGPDSDGKAGDRGDN